MNIRIVSTIEELDRLPETAHVWGASHRHPDKPGTGAPYEKLSSGEWWDYGNDYSVGPSDIRLPAVVVGAAA